MGRLFIRWFPALILSLLVASAQRAQGAALGKGWTLGPGGSLTTDASEVIAGSASIKGTGSGPGVYVPFLYAEPSIIHFAAGQTYTLSVRYRIVKAASGAFGFGFNSPSLGAAGFGPGGSISGPDGATGTTTVVAPLLAASDYALSFGVFGTGTIVIDDIRITDAGGRLVADETAEGPSLTPGPLAWRIIDAMSLLTPSSASVVSAARGDLDGDGYPEVVLALTAPRPSTTSLEPILLQANGTLRIANSEFFPGGMLRVKASPMTLFVDINGDGLVDLLLSDAGSDAPPFPGSKIGVGLNLGGGRFRDVSGLIPDDLALTRSYAIAAGDLKGDGGIEIVVPDQSRGVNTALLRWNGQGFDVDRNWISQALWSGASLLSHQTWMAVADFDRDGRQDLLVSGTPDTPTLRVVFGETAGMSNGTLVELPAGPWGWTPPATAHQPIEQGAEVGPVVVADFDNDGLPDIFAIERQILSFQPGAINDIQIPGYASILADGGYFPSTAALQVLLNRGSRRFEDVSSASSSRTLQRAQYVGLIPVDLNNDGFIDLVGVYATELYGDSRDIVWGTTFFFNDGSGAFQVVDGSHLIGVTTTPDDGRRWSLGGFVPTLVRPGRTEGVAFAQVGGCGVGLCDSAGVKLYKVVANGSFGTGPNFIDPAPLGAPGFNEFYYLRRHADAAAAVKAGQYASGLAHYLDVGQGLGYAPAYGTPTGLKVSASGSSVTLSWSAPDEARASAYVLEAGSAPGLSDIVSVQTGASTVFSTNGVPDGTYYVRIRSIVGSATSAPSNELGVSVGSCNSPPRPPSDLSATVEDSTVRLHWMASHGLPQYYVLDVGSESGRSDLLSANLGSLGTTFAAPHVAAGKYYGRIRAINACGSSDPSNEVFVTIGG